MRTPAHLALVLAIGFSGPAAAQTVLSVTTKQTFKAPSGFTLTMDATNHHLHKPVLIGEVRADGQFDVVWQTQQPIRAQPWSPFIEGNEGKQGL